MIGHFTATLIAQADWLARFRLRSNTDPRSLLALAILLTGVVLIVWLSSRWFQLREQRRTHSPASLFRELCRAHALPSSDRSLLLRLASHHRMPQPAVIFLSPQAFEAAQLPAAFSAQSEQIQRLRERLFASIPRHP